jgi:hypothetical protein
MSFHVELALEINVISYTLSVSVISRILVPFLTPRKAYSLPSGAV